MSDETPAEAAVLRAFSGLPNMALTGLCFLIAVGHIYVAFDPIISEFQRNAYHFAGFAFLAAVLHPLVRGKTRSKPMLAFDLTLGSLVAMAAIYMPYAEQGIYDRGVKFSTLDWIAAVICVIGAIELTRRLTGWVIPSLIIIALSYVGWWGSMIGGVFSFPGLSWESIAFRSIFGDDAMFGTIARISSTFVFLFIIFGAFLLRSGAGDFVINIARAIAGRLVGGPGIVAVIASGLTGTISGSAVANTASTGVITIPLMKKVGYPRQSAGAIEAAASTGGQIMPPIMGAGAFIMAEITGIPYTDIAIAAVIPAVLYFLSISFMVDFEAGRLGMRGMRDDELPKFNKMVRQVYLFIPIIILIVALFVGYSVIRAGTLATVAAAVVSWLTPHRMGLRSILKAFELAGVMSIQIIAVCACAGIIVGVISLTGVGARFSSLLLDLAGVSQLLALFFAMCIAILLGMGMPTTAAYAVAASVVAPGLLQLGIPTLTAHFFVFYFAVLSAITPPVALASYAAAGISGSNPMETSVASFKIGIAAFIVPFMFFYSSAILMEGDWYIVLKAGVTAVFGVFLLSSGVQGWFFGAPAAWFMRVGILLAALFMISGGLITDLIGIAVFVAVYFVQKVIAPPADAQIAVKGLD